MSSSDPKLRARPRPIYQLASAPTGATIVIPARPLPIVCQRHEDCYTDECEQFMVWHPHLVVHSWRPPRTRGGTEGARSDQLMIFAANRLPYSLTAPVGFYPGAHIWPTGIVCAMERGRRAAPATYTLAQRTLWLFQEYLTTDMAYHDLGDDDLCVLPPVLARAYRSVSRYAPSGRTQALYRRWASLHRADVLRLPWGETKPLQEWLRSSGLYSEAETIVYHDNSRRV